MLETREISPDTKTFTDAEVMIASGEIDLVVISTPPNSHFLWAKKALNANLHVVLEKPMALTLFGQGNDCPNQRLLHLIHLYLKD